MIIESQIKKPAQIVSTKKTTYYITKINDNMYTLYMLTFFLQSWLPKAFVFGTLSIVIFIPWSSIQPTHILKIVFKLFIYVLIWYINLKSCNPPYKYYTSGNLLFSHYILCLLFTSIRPPYYTVLLFYYKNLPWNSTLNWHHNQQKQSIVSNITNIHIFIFVYYI